MSSPDSEHTPNTDYPSHLEDGGTDQEVKVHTSSEKSQPRDISPQIPSIPLIPVDRNPNLKELVKQYGKNLALLVVGLIAGYIAKDQLSTSSEEGRRLAEALTPTVTQAILAGDTETDVLDINQGNGDFETIESTPTPSQTPSQTPSLIPSATSTPTETPSATATPTIEATSTPTPTAEIKDITQIEIFKNATENKDESPYLNNTSIAFHKGVVKFVRENLKAMSLLPKEKIKEVFEQNRLLQIFWETPDGGVKLGWNNPERVDSDFDSLGLGFEHTDPKALEAANDYFQSHLEERFIHGQLETVLNKQNLDPTILIVPGKDGLHRSVVHTDSFNTLQIGIDTAFAGVLMKLDPQMSLEEALYEAAIIRNNLLLRFLSSIDGYVPYYVIDENGYLQIASQPLMRPGRTCRFDLAPSYDDSRSEQQPTLVEVPFVKVTGDEQPHGVIALDDPESFILVVDIHQLALNWASMSDAEKRAAITEASTAEIITSPSQERTVIEISGSYELGAANNGIHNPEDGSVDNPLRPCGPAQEKPQAPAVMPSAAPPVQEIPAEEYRPPTTQVTSEPQPTPRPEEHKSPDEDEARGGYEDDTTNRDEPVDEEVPTPKPLPTAPPAEATPFGDW
jgi:hypothetical protein